MRGRARVIRDEQRVMGGDCSRDEFKQVERLGVCENFVSDRSL